MSGDPRLLVLSPVFTAAEVAVSGSPTEAAELAPRATAGSPWAARLRAAGRTRTIAEHTFVPCARALEALWTA